MATFYFIGTIVLYSLIAAIVLFGLGGLTKAIIDDVREKREREQKRESSWRSTYDFWTKRCFGFQAEAEHLRKDYQEAMQAKWAVIAELENSKRELELKWDELQALEYELDQAKSHIKHLEAELEVAQEEDCYPEERVTDYTLYQGYLAPQIERAQPNMVPHSKPFVQPKEAEDEGYDPGYAMLPASYRD